MTIEDVVASFYADIWNRGDLSAIPALLREDFTFRGSLGPERTGHAGFAAYVAMVRAALAEYRCDVLDLVTEDRRAFARMRFSGVHAGEFLGFAPTGQRVEWLGAALFTCAEDGRVADLWVLGDVAGLTAQLQAHALGERVPAARPQPRDAAAVEYGAAVPGDLDDVRQLLGRLDLPAQDVGRSNQTFVIARVGGELVGCVGLERYGDDVLLRSLGVVPRLQGSGLGKALYARAVEDARRSGTRALYLLTTTAAPFFAKAGFERIDRDQVPAAVRESPEFRSLCPASAVCMKLELR